MEREFAPARPAANHCAELLNHGASGEDIGDALPDWRASLVRDFAAAMASLLPGGKLQAALSEIEIVPREQTAERIGNASVNCLMRCGASEATALMSIAPEIALALTDRSFGGDGAIGEALAPDALPRSASLLIDSVAEALAGTLAEIAGQPAATAMVLLRSDNAARIMPASRGKPCAIMTINLAEDGGFAWPVQLVISQSDLPSFLPSPGLAQPKGRRESGGGECWQIPLSVSANIAEFELPLRRLKSLRPGDEFAIPAPSAVAMLVEGRRFAAATVGSEGDRLALRVSRMDHERALP